MWRKCSLKQNRTFSWAKLRMHLNLYCTDWSSSFDIILFYLFILFILFVKRRRIFQWDLKMYTFYYHFIAPSFREIYESSLCICISWKFDWIIIQNDSTFKYTLITFIAIENIHCYTWSTAFTFYCTMYT